MEFEKLKAELVEQEVSLVAVSKTKPVSAILELYEQGQRTFGENRVQELVEKYEEMPKDISWHLIGHLQKNKVKYIAPFVSLIHSADNIKLLRVINKEAAKNDRTIPVLLQIKIAEEDTKYGFDFQELLQLVKSSAFTEFDHLSFHGVMGMATFTDNQEQVREEFNNLANHHQELSSFFDTGVFKIISMGMSGDYQIAIECGSNMVRIGSLLFGARD